MDRVTELIGRNPILKECEEDIRAGFRLLVDSFEDGKRLYICGNGGSAADALHIVGELMKSFELERPIDKEFALNGKNMEVLLHLQGALPAFSLVENSAFSTAFGNDCEADYIFAQQVYGYMREGDVFWGISTSGNSRNILLACETARLRGGRVIGLTGGNGGRLKNMSDVCICVPEVERYRIQEFHVQIYHAICLMVEEYFWGRSGIWKQ